MTSAQRAAAAHPSLDLQPAYVSVLDEALDAADSAFADLQATQFSNDALFHVWAEASRHLVRVAGLFTPRTPRPVTAPRR